MKIQVLQSALKKGIGMVSRAVAAKSPVAIVLNIKVSAQDDVLTLEATDFKSAITYTLPCTVTTPGQTTIPAKLFSDVISSLPNEILSLTTDVATEITTIASQKSKSAVNGVKADDFPVIPSLDDFEKIAEVDAHTFRIALQRVAIAAANTESRPVLAGVFFQCTANNASAKEITITAADGFRLAQQTFAVDNFFTNNATEFIVPANTLIEFGKIITFVDGNVTVVRNNRQMALQMRHSDNGTISAVSTLIEGNYPNIAMFTSIQTNTQVIVEKVELLNAVKLSRLFSASSNNIVQLKFDPFSDIELQANGDGKGKNVTSVSAEFEGSPLTVALNVNYMEDAINTIATDKVKICLASDKQPALFLPTDDTKYKHIVMPMMVRN